MKIKGSPPSFRIFITIIQERSSCGRGPSSELTPTASAASLGHVRLTASAASLGHVRLQAVARDSRFARYCEDNTLADAPILNTNIYQF